VRIRRKGLTRENKDHLMNLAMELFLQGPHMGFANTTLELIGAKNLRNCYEGLQAVNLPSEGYFDVETSSTRGDIKTAWFTQMTSTLQEHDYSYDREYEYIIHFPTDIKDIIGNASIVFDIILDTGNSSVTLSGLGEPETKEIGTEGWKADYFSELVYSSTSSDWNEAKSICQGSGGHISSITSQEEQDRMSDIKSGFWLGATNIEDGETWKWDDGSPWNYTNWADGHPTLYGNCAYMSYDSKWKTTSCSRLRLYFCKTMVPSLTLKGTNLTLAFTKKSIQGHTAVIRWSYQTHG
jgi:hypothetical protein